MARRLAFTLLWIAFLCFAVWLYGRNVLRPGQSSFLQILELAALVLVLQVGKDLVKRIRRPSVSGGAPPGSS